MLLNKNLGALVETLETVQVAWSCVATGTKLPRYKEVSLVRCPTKILTTGGKLTVNVANQTLSCHGLPLA